MLAVLPRVCRTSLGGFQSACNIFPLRNSACTWAAPEIKCAKVKGTLTLQSDACKRLPGLPRSDCRKSLGRFQIAWQPFALWASTYSCAAPDLKCAKVQGTLSLRSNALQTTCKFAQSMQNKFGPIPKC